MNICEAILAKGIGLKDIKKSKPDSVTNKPKSLGSCDQHQHKTLISRLNFKSQLWPKLQNRISRLKIELQSQKAVILRTASNFRFKLSLQTSNVNFKLQLQHSTSNFNLVFSLQIQTSISNLNFKLQLQSATSNFNFKPQPQLLTSSPS